MKDLLRELTGAFGPSGYESEVRKLIQKRVRGLATEVRTDALGNLIVRRAPRTKAAGKGKRIMIAAHLDEIGLMASHVDANGFVRFAAVGYLYPRNLPGSRVIFSSGVRGVVGVEPTEKLGDVPPLNKMYIDVGATSKGSCPVTTGDVAVFERPFLGLGDRLVAKAMDDRAGCAVAIEVLRSLGRTDHDVYVVFTSREEVGSSGAETSAYGIDPDIGIAIDVTGWGDTPGIRHFDIGLGRGPAIKIRDSGMLSDPRVVEWMIKTAERNRVPYQREVLLGGTTDAQVIQVARAGVPVGCISIPCRYVHSASEMVELGDLRNAVKLIVALLRSPAKLD